MDFDLRSAVRYLIATGDFSACSSVEIKQLQEVLKNFLNREAKKTSVYFCSTRHGYAAPDNNVACEFYDYAQSGYWAIEFNNSYHPGDYHACDIRTIARSTPEFTFYQNVNGHLESVKTITDNGNDQIAVHRSVFTLDNAAQRILEAYRLGSAQRRKKLESNQKAVETRKRNAALRASQK
jgi:hypothetical protein